jgi:hypothetical protein
MLVARAARLFVGNRDHLRPPRPDLVLRVQQASDLLMRHLFAPAASRILNHSDQTFPVLALTASSLMAGLMFGIDELLFVPIVGDLQPTLHFIIDILQQSDFEPMCDAIFLGEPAGVD